MTHEVTKRLSAIAKARSFVEWPKIKELRADLELQQRTIAEQVARIDAAEALELMWRFLALANSVLNRCDYSSGVMGDIFRGAVEDLAGWRALWEPAPDIAGGQGLRRVARKSFGLIRPLDRSLGRPIGA